MRWTENRLTGWHSVLAPQSMIDDAKAERARRDALWGNRYPVEGEDRRWHGHLGEAIFVAWLRKIGVDFQHFGERDGEPDFVAAGFRCAHKNVHVGHEMKPAYGVAVPVIDSEQPVDLFTFTCYEPTTSRAHVLGCDRREDFIANATLQEAGSAGFGVTAWAKANFVLAADALFAPRTLAAALRHGA